MFRVNSCKHYKNSELLTWDRTSQAWLEEQKILWNNDEFYGFENQSELPRVVSHPEYGLRTEDGTRCSYTSLVKSDDAFGRGARETDSHAKAGPSKPKQAPYPRPGRLGPRDLGRNGPRTSRAVEDGAPSPKTPVAEPEALVRRAPTRDSLSAVGTAGRPEKPIEIKSCSCLIAACPVLCSARGCGLCWDRRFSKPDRSEAAAAAAAAGVESNAGTRSLAGLG
ncbi:hypothetical protein NL676_004425 [Syzygium grande]|nr:hypothetical protein NL676_004425 [Syzygium grande]